MRSALSLLLLLAVGHATASSPLNLTAVLKPAVANKTGDLVTAVTLAKAFPRSLPYPGTCAGSTTNCFKTCPGFTCAADTGDANTVCGVLTFPAATQGWTQTYCMPDFRDTCAQQSGCSRCSLWRIISQQCPPGNPDLCYNYKYYAVLNAKMPSPTLQDTLCLSKTHWLVLPTHPCPGIESTDPLCTGSPAEKLWGAAYVTGVSKGFPPHGGSGQVGPMTGRWAALLNAPNWRGQHQLHIHIAFFKTSAPNAQVVPLYIAQTTFSTDVGSPTVLTGPDGTATATVFVPGTLAGEAKAAALVAGRAVKTNDDGGLGAGLATGIKSAIINTTAALPGIALDAKDDGFKVAPFELTSQIGAKVKPNVPFGMMVEPYTQDVKGVPVKGFLVSAIYYFSDFEAMDDAETDTCSPACKPFQ